MELMWLTDLLTMIISNHRKRRVPGGWKALIKV
jgi:hypothetical protein